MNNETYEIQEITNSQVKEDYLFIEKKVDQQ